MTEGVTMTTAEKTTTVEHVVTDHVAKPGPDYWSWRCLECGAEVRQHTPALRQLLQRLRARLSRP